MKKVSYITAFILLVSLFFAHTANSLPTQQVNTCPGKPYPVSNFLTRGLQGILFLNWSASKIAESQVKKQIEKMVEQGEVKVNIKPYSAMDLIAGKARKFEIKGKDISMDGLAISYIEAQSLCDLVYIDYKKNPITPLAPLYLGFKGTITEKDFNKILSSKKYQDNVSSLKMKVFGADLNLINFLNPKIDIEGNKIFLSANLHFIGTPKFMVIPIKVGAGLKVRDNKIRLTDLQMLSKDPRTKTGPIYDFIESMTLAAFDISSLNKDGTVITIKNINVDNDKVDIEGTVWIAAKNSK